MVRLDGVEVVEDSPASFPGDNEFTLEGELADLVEADAEDVGRFECRDLVGHGVPPVGIVQVVGIGWSQVWVANVGRCLCPAGYAAMRWRSRGMSCLPA
jgi:hypothetical protein